MELIQELSSGFQDAPNGTAQVFVRGTSTPARYFNDYDGLSPVTAGTPVVLDSNGAAEVYVNQLISIIVTNASGAVVEDNIPGSASPLVEVRSPSFIGTDPVSAVRSAGAPLSLQEALDLVLTSFGSTDWRVLVNGTATNLGTALGGVLGVLFNVKDPTYGAVGDSTADDTSAIQAAVTAAAVAGGVVYFPQGTSSNAFYKTLSVITVPSNVSLLGAGPQASSIKIDSSTASVFSTTINPSGTVANQFISNLEIGFVQSNTGSAVEVSSTMPLLAQNCQLGGSFSAPSQALVRTTVAGSSITMKNCTLEVGNDGSLFLASASSDGAFDYCRFLSSAVARTKALVVGQGTVRLTNSTLDASAAVSGTHTLLDLATNTVTDATILGNRFLGNAAGTVTGIETPTLGLSTARISEAGNTWVNVDTIFNINSDYTGAPVNQSSSMSSRDGLTLVDNDAALIFTLDSESYGNAMIRYFSTGDGSPIITLKDAYPGAHFSMFIWNNGSGGPLTTVLIRTESSGSTVLGFAGGLTITDNNTAGFTFMYVHRNAALGGAWVMTSQSLS